MKKLIKQMANEWRSNVWLGVELLIVSVLLWFCAENILSNVVVLAEPRGHDISHTYRIYFGKSDYCDSQELETFINRLRMRPEVEAAAFSSNAVPYTFSNSTASVLDEDSIPTVFVPSNAIKRWVQSDFFRVFRLNGVRGETPEQLAEILIPGTNVIGVTDGTLVDSLGEKLRTVDYIGHSMNLNGYPNHRIAAVVKPMKRFDNEPWGPSWAGECVFDMMSFGSLRSANELSVRVRANMDDGSFAEKLMLDAGSVNTDRIYLMNVQSFADVRRNAQLESTTLLRNMVVGAIFLLINLFLGLLGTFWFRTQQRTGEIALHRVGGATRGQMFARLISEGLLLLLIVTPFAVATDCLVLSREWVANQFTAPQHCIIIGLSTLIMALMILLGVWLPARRAMNVSSVEALRGE